MNEPLGSLILKATRELGLSTHKEIAEFLGVSLRTVQRNSHQGGVSYPEHYSAIVQALHPRNSALAQRIADALHKTLPELGVELPPPPPPPAPVVVAPPPRPPPVIVLPPPPPPAPPPPSSKVTRAHADAVICAAAEALGVAPRDARPLVEAIFTRVRDFDINLSLIVPLLAARPVEQAKVQGKR